ncbi:MAG TPA: sulfatase, partial [Polyangiaceae bacterium]|nr:sulfatase [Polyangiaceae bacterium]
KTEAPPPSPSASAAVASTSAELAVSATPPPASADPVPPVPSTPRNVLLVTIDSLRADMPWTGYPRAIAPNLTKLADESVVYTNEYALSSYTAKSVAGFLSSRYPSTLYRSGYFFASYPKSDTFLAEVLSAHGIATTGWHAHLYFRGVGLDQGFNTWQFVPGITFDPQTDTGITSQLMTELGIKLLSKPENTGKQFFAWAHYMDPHDQYNKHAESPDFGNKNRDRYDSEVFYTDLWVGKLLDFARAQPWWKDTVLIVSADHGEAFGEHGFYKHAFEIWDVLTRVPLLVSGPGIKPKRISERRSHIDLAPTILDLMGVPPEPEFMGKSFTPELFGAKPDNREPIVCELTEDSHNPPRRAVILGDYKLIVIKERKFQLYDLSKDPGEETDLAETEPDKLDEMKKVYTGIYDKMPVIEPYGGVDLKEGGVARGPMGPKPDKDAGTSK